LRCGATLSRIREIRMSRTVRVLALAAACALAISVEGGHWWSTDEASIGPAAGAQCFGGNCEPTSLDWVGGSAGWIRWGAATHAAGMVGALVLVILAATLASRRRGRLPAKMTIAAALAAVGAGAAFVGTFPGFPGTLGMRTDRGMWLYFGGVVVAAAAAALVLRARETTA
jgi:hypothetical protein